MATANTGYKPQPPKEDQEQEALMRWAAYQSGKFPELSLLYHIPNGGSRNKAEARALRRRGVKAGVPDLCLPVARSSFHGLYIELKRQTGGRITDNQDEWIDSLIGQGYRVEVCKGFQAAVDVILDYLNDNRGGV
jgi:hypothetical protein